METGALIQNTDNTPWSGSGRSLTLSLVYSQGPADRAFPSAYSRITSDQLCCGDSLITHPLLNWTGTGRELVLMKISRLVCESLLNSTLSMVLEEWAMDGEAEAQASC